MHSKDPGSCFFSWISSLLSHHECSTSWPSSFPVFFFTTCRGTKHQIVLCSPWVFPNKGCQSGGPLKTPSPMDEHNQLGFFRMSTWSLYFLPSSYQYWPITITVCVDFQSLIRLGEWPTRSLNWGPVPQLLLPHGLDLGASWRSCFKLMSRF